MSARRATRPDLAIAEIRTVWTPKPLDRVRRINQTTLAAITYGTARVLETYPDGRTVSVAVDQDPAVEAIHGPKWTRWPIDQTVLATAPTTNTTE